MKEALKISVIIPVYNSEKYILESLQSIFNQTYKPFEVIVIDDGSMDNSAEIIKQFSEINYYYKEHSGIGASLNVGLNKATGDLIAFLDADDYWALDKLEKQVAYLMSNSDKEVVYGYHQRFYTKSLEELTTSELADTQRILPGYFKAALLAKKEVFKKVGLFDESIRIGDFLDWYRRASDLGLNMGMISEVVFYRRIHGENSSLKNNVYIADYVKIMKASMDRRRGK
jgi:glycosyltransferase involved in cell wall biosynthesis